MEPTQATAVGLSFARAAMPGDPFYQTALWRSLRAACLKRDGNQCRTTGCGKRASHADHIKPRRAGGLDVLDNLVSYCWTCHSRKTAQRDGGFGHKPSHRLAVGTDGWPVEAGKR